MRTVKRREPPWSWRTRCIIYDFISSQKNLKPWALLFQTERGVSERQRRWRLQISSLGPPRRSGWFVTAGMSHVGAAADQLFRTNTDLRGDGWMSGLMDGWRDWWMDESSLKVSTQCDGGQYLLQPRAAWTLFMYQTHVYKPDGQWDN